MGEFITGTGQRLTDVHDKSECKGNCPIHNPSDHHMKDWPLHWRDDRRMFERIDPMGVGHPDPDDLKYQKSLLPNFDDGDYLGVHGCNGLCTPEGYLKYLKKLELTDRNKIKWTVKEIRNCISCSICGKKPIEWHSEDHIGNNHRRISSLVQRNSYSTILEEIEKCIPLCRSCHMKEDNRLNKLKENQPQQKGKIYVEKKPCICCGKFYKPLRNGMCSSCDNHHSGRRLRKTVSCKGCFDEKRNVDKYKG